MSTVRYRMRHARILRGKRTRVRAANKRARETFMVGLVRRAIWRATARRT